MKIRIEIDTEKGEHLKDLNGPSNLAALLRRTAGEIGSCVTLEDVESRPLTDIDGCRVGRLERTK